MMKNKILNLIVAPFILIAAAAAVADIPIDTTSLDGDYNVEFNTGDHTFHDLMLIKGTHLSNPNGPLEGQISVQGVFTSPLTGNYQTRVQWSGTSLLFNFSITANENDQSYKVYYKGTLSLTDYADFLNGTTQPAIHGDVFVDGETASAALKKIGSFTAVRYVK